MAHVTINCNYLKLNKVIAISKNKITNNYLDYAVH